MNKTAKKALITTIIVIGICAGLYFGIRTVYNMRKSPVNVYPASSFAMTDYWGDSMESYGSVRTDQLQKIFLSSTQTVSEVFVEEGQEIHKGDKILAYDTTLTALDVTKAEISLDRAKQQLQQDQETLMDYRHLLFREQLEAEIDKLNKELKVAIAEARKLASQTDLDVITPIIPSGGDGSSENPIYQAYSNSFALTVLSDVYAPNSGDDAYVVLYKDNSGIAESYMGVHVINQEGNINLSFFDPPALELPDDAAMKDAKVQEIQHKLYHFEGLLEISVPFDELKKMINDQIDAVNTSELNVQIAQLDLDKKRAEVQDGAIYASIDGIIKKARTTEDANTTGEAIVEISGGGGYYITAGISELQLKDITIGSSAQIMSWDTGIVCEGTIQEISPYPSTNQMGYSSGNNNVSWYPVTIFVDESANLQENEMVQMTFEGKQKSNSWYLENEFIRTLSGKSYVYLRNEDGVLEQRFIQTGNDLWGSYTEIRGGLTLDDYLAFPYGQDVGPGAKTVEATPDQLYNGF